MEVQNLQSSPAYHHQVTSVTVTETEGGAYYTWLDSNTTSPVLGQANLGAGRLVLHPRGFALPHYADAYKIGFVVQGSCRVGIVLPDGNAKEHVLTIKKGDIIPVHLGAMSWWYNAESTDDVEIIFLGETSKIDSPSQFDYFFLTGAMGVLGGFSNDFISHAFGLGENESEKLVKSQTGAVIVKLAEGQNHLPEPTITCSNNITAYNLENAKPFIHVNRGGSVTVADAENVDSLKGFGLSASLLKLEANSMLGPIATADSSSQVFYLLEGSGRIQISGLGGKNAFDATLKKGDLFVVPRFFAAALMADEEGLQCVSALTSSQTCYVKFGGKKSVCEALSPSVLQVAFNVELDLIQLLKSNLGSSTDIIVPPKH